MSSVEELVRIEAPKVKMVPEELPPAARDRLKVLLRRMMQAETNKQQVKEPFVHFPTPEENKEAARERRTTKTPKHVKKRATKGKKKKK